MSYRFLIVEDQLMIALRIEDVITSLGHTLVGIATNRSDAIASGLSADIAFVDVNLDDGATGPEIGEVLAREADTSVLFMTSNPEALGNGIPGTLGVVPKPLLETDLIAAVQYMVDRRSNIEAVAPERLVAFGNGGIRQNAYSHL